MKTFRWTGAALGLVAGVVLTLLIQNALALPKGYSPFRKLNIFARVLTHVENSYVESVDGTELIHGAISGMMEVLDPHSVFLPPDQYKQMQVDTRGEFGGVGIEVEIRNEWLTVVTPIQGTPAERAGLRSGDQIRKINGQSTEGMKMHQAVTLMRGPRGTRVSLTIVRPGQKKPLQLAIVRDIIKIVSVEGRWLQPHIAHIRLKAFQEETGDTLRRDLERLQKERPIKGLILDLRNNPGGLLAEAAKVADLFLQKGMIVRTKGKGQVVMDEETAHRRGTFPDFPMICLVNGGSASASEIVAGALQDHRRAVVLGLPTFGKGSVQSIIDLPDGSGLKLTVARYYTPSGRSIQETGIVPDILVQERAPAPAPERATKREKDLKHHLPAEGGATSRPAPPPQLDDFQLQTALGYLKAADIFGQRKR